MIPQEKIIAFLKKHPSPNDMLVHHFAKQHGWEIDKVEEAMYKIAGAYIKKDIRSKNRKAYRCSECPFETNNAGEAQQHSDKYTYGHNIISDKQTIR